MDATTIQAGLGLLGAIIGFCGSYYAINRHTENERKRILLEKRCEVYVKMLNLIQDYQTSKTNGKKIAISNNDIHTQYYNLLSDIYVYASKNVKNAFSNCWNNTKKGSKDNDYTKLAEIIRKDLKID